MDKLTLAHDYAMNMIKTNKMLLNESMPLLVKYSMNYAEAMLAEQEKRADKTRPAVLEEFQVDWSQAPEWANWWAMDKNGVANWYDTAPSIGGIEWVYGRGGDSHSEDQEFKYDNNWRNSLQERK